MSRIGIATGFSLAFVLIYGCNSLDTGLKNLRRKCFTGGLVLISLLMVHKQFWIIILLAPMKCDVVYGLNIVITVVKNKLSRLSPIGLVFCQLIFHAINFVVWNGVPKAIQPAYKIYWSTLSFQCFWTPKPTKTCVMSKVLRKWDNDFELWTLLIFRRLWSVQLHSLREVNSVHTNTSIKGSVMYLAESTSFSMGGQEK